MNIGIIQGRLSERPREPYQGFPGETQANAEFFNAANLGFSHMELVADAHPDNFLHLDPLPYYIKTLKELEEIKKLASKTVPIKSICADILMVHLLVESKKAIDILYHLITYCYTLNATYLILPFVDSSTVKNQKDLDKVKDILDTALIYARTHNVIICLEMDLPPKDFYKFIKRFHHPNLKINYDTGNSTALGYDIDQEFNWYGKYIEVIHIKDRLLNGGSVGLGEGDVDWKRFFKNLKRIRFKGLITLQAARAQGEETEIEKVTLQLNKFKEMIGKYYV